ALSLEEGPAGAAGAKTRPVAASQGDTAHWKQSYTGIWRRLWPGLCCKLRQAPAGVSSGGSRRRSMGPARAPDLGLRAEADVAEARNAPGPRNTHAAAAPAGPAATTPSRP